MEQHEQERFDQLYAQHLQALTLQSKRGKTIDGYARAVRRIAGFFNRCPDNLTVADLKTYFAWMVENYSWSSVKVDLWGGDDDSPGPNGRAQPSQAVLNRSVVSIILIDQ